MNAPPEETVNHGARVDVVEHDSGVVAAQFQGDALQYEFFSVVTHPRIWKEAASTPDQAWHQIAVWTSAPAVSLLGETEDFLVILEGFARRPRVRGPMVHDARVAAGRPGGRP